MKNKLLTLVALQLGLTATMAQPVITSQPTNQTVVLGSTASFSVVATGVPPLSYQWRSHDTSTTFTNIPFGTEATLVLTNVQPTPRRFAVVVIDADGLSVTSSPSVRVTVLVPPSITGISPSNSIAEVGDTITFNVIANGTPPLSYQWRVNGTNLAGKTSTNLTLVGVELTDAAGYTLLVTNIAGAATSHVAALTMLPAVFEQVTQGAIVNDFGFWIRGVWADFNNDGFLDLLVSNYASTNGLYLNNRDGTFTRTIRGNSVVDIDSHTGVAAADFDNDGNIDLLVSAGVQSPNPRENRLYRGNGDGSFRRMTNALPAKAGFFNACLWADYDRDGFVDVFVTDNGDSNNAGGKCRLYRGHGDGTFDGITNGPVVMDIGAGIGAAWADYDNDGFMDLIVINYGDNARNYLYHNQQNGQFTRVAAGPIATDSWSQGAISCAWGDYDNDGLPDLYVTDAGGIRNRLYHNLGRGSFAPMSASLAPMVLPPAGGNSMGCAWGDYDNDGFLDLFVASRYATNTLYHNNGDGSFTRVYSGAPAHGGGAGMASKGVTWVDFDNDGFLDLFVTADNGPTQGPNFLYHNRGNSNGWLEVRCVGAVANRSALGVRIQVEARIGDRLIHQVRELNGGGGYSTAPLVAHFGLGDAVLTETLRVAWPSGTTQEFKALAPRQILTVTEPSRLAIGQTNGGIRVTLHGARGLPYRWETSTNLSDWSAEGTETITNVSGAILLDAGGLPANPRFFRASGP